VAAGLSTSGGSSRVSPAELALITSDPIDPPSKVGWVVVLQKRETWAFLIGKFLTDPVWWLFLFWLPDFFAKTYGLNLKTFGPPLVAVYLLADVGSIGGGWLSSWFIRRGWSVNRGRKITMLICALCVTPISFAIFANNLLAAVAIIGVAAAAHQGWSANLYTLVSDVFPKRAVATVVGVGSAGGAIGGMFISKFAGWTLETTGSYLPLLLLAGGAYLLALIIIQGLTPRLRPVVLPE
jgi:ACS family hexuronate transporter-like MFS transporter